MPWLDAGGERQLLDEGSGKSRVVPANDACVIGSCRRRHHPTAWMQVTEFKGS